MDDFLLLGPDSAILLRQSDAIAHYLRRELRLQLHSGKEQLGLCRHGIAYLGYRVYPHYLHPKAGMIKTLKARLDFFKHLFWPDVYPRFQKPVRGTWQALAAVGELTPPLTPDWTTLKRMEATINCYLGIMGHAQARTMRKKLYEKHLGPLQQFFIPANAAYTAVNVKKRWLHV